MERAHRHRELGRAHRRQRDHRPGRIAAGRGQPRRGRRDGAGLRRRERQDPGHRPGHRDHAGHGRHPRRAAARRGRPDAATVRLRPRRRPPRFRAQPAGRPAHAQRRQPGDGDVGADRARTGRQRLRRPCRGRLRRHEVADAAGRHAVRDRRRGGGLRSGRGQGRRPDLHRLEGAPGRRAPVRLRRCRIRALGAGTQPPGQPRRRRRQDARLRGLLPRRRAGAGQHGRGAPGPAGARAPGRVRHGRHALAGRLRPPQRRLRLRARRLRQCAARRQRGHAGHGRQGLLHRRHRCHGLRRLRRRRHRPQQDPGRAGRQSLRLRRRGHRLRPAEPEGPGRHPLHGAEGQRCEHGGLRLRPGGVRALGGRGPPRVQHRQRRRARAEFRRHPRPRRAHRCRAGAAGLQGLAPGRVRRQRDGAAVGLRLPQRRHRFRAPEQRHPAVRGQRHAAEPGAGCQGLCDRRQGHHRLRRLRRGRHRPQQEPGGAVGQPVRPGRRGPLLRPAQRQGQGRHPLHRAEGQRREPDRLRLRRQRFPALGGRCPAGAQHRQHVRA